MCMCVYVYRLGACDYDSHQIAGAGCIRPSVAVLRTSRRGARCGIVIRAPDRVTLCPPLLSVRPTRCTTQNRKSSVCGREHSRKNYIRTTPKYIVAPPTTTTTTTSTRVARFNRSLATTQHLSTAEPTISVYDSTRRDDVYASKSIVSSIVT